MPPSWLGDTASTYDRWWVRSVGNGDKWLKRVKTDALLQVPVKIWHKKLKWNSLFKIWLNFF